LRRKGVENGKGERIGSRVEGEGREGIGSDDGAWDALYARSETRPTVVGVGKRIDV
jgi:hypothetical protein